MPLPRKGVFDEAREAFRLDNYQEALEHYDYFFDYALADDPAFYGVRLSYCLSEWANLAQKYPAAKERLLQKKQAAIKLLEQTRDPERFHDYVSLCRYLKFEHEPGDQFLIYHSSDQDLAQSIVRFIWDDLIAAG